jgi:acyl carrier protein
MELREEILQKIIKKASTLFGKNPDEMNENTRFVEDLNAKSANYVQIISVLEDEYDVEITFMEFRRKKTFGEAADFVVQLLEA